VLHRALSVRALRGARARRIRSEAWLDTAVKHLRAALARAPAVEHAAILSAISGALVRAAGAQLEGSSGATAHP
jgi:hypothetical protein